MKMPSLLIAAGLLLVALPSLVPTASAQHEGETLTINDATRTGCIALAPVEEAAGVAQSCATATLSGTIQTCWNDGAYHCSVTFTATSTAGPLVCGAFSSQVAGFANACWTLNPTDPANQPTSTSRSPKPIVFDNIPRDGVTAVSALDLNQKEFLHVTPFPGESTVGTNDTTWYPSYVFPADLTASGSGCNGGSASVQGASVSVTVISDPLGIAKTVTVNGPRTDTDPTGANAKATASTPGTC